MTQHHLQGRNDTELLWFQRRSFLQAAATWTAMGSMAGALAQSRSNIVELVGDATVNGQKLMPQHSVQSGDEIVTGPGSTLIFVIGNSAFHMRQNTSMVAERGTSITAVSLLRLLTGAVVSVWGKGSNRQIVTPTLTAGIRGTGVYTEMFANQNGARTYFCNCYGVVDLAAGSDREVSESTYHQAVWGEAALDGRSALTPARAINHTDEELENLARLIGERTAWQISGKKGNKGDNYGFIG
jgi:hypothetical protein